jgi:hypothetical protein
MKKLIIILVVSGMCSFSFAQHTQTDSKTEITTDKAMLDGKVFSVTLTENIPGTTGTPGNISTDERMENPDLTKRDVESTQAGKSNTENKDLKDNRKMLIRFENGDVKISGKGEIKNEKCPYKSWGIESTGISFSADCKSTGNSSQTDKANTSSLITGTVNGDTVHGTLTCTKNDGTIKTYSYTGSKAGPNDLDMEQEMGMK